jgi:hypothetical protein
MKKIVFKFNKAIKTFACVFCLSFISASCADYLDIVPEEIPTIDNAFKNRTEARNYLYGCYSFLPQIGDCLLDPAMLGSDEISILEIVYNNQAYNLRHIARGEQKADDPYANFWASKQGNPNLRGGTALFTALRDCNIFLENIHLPFDLEENEREQWIGEIKFLKAYYHFWLFRMYGPIPLIKENLPIDLSGKEVQIYREPVDEVTDYIVSLLDEAASLLPLTVENDMDEMGRATKTIALAMKAQVLTYVASPLFNCNTDYSDFVDNRGKQLFPQDKGVEKEKWKKAADALKVAIETAEEALYKLYDFHSNANAPLLNEKTILAMQVRGAATERWNSEIIWGSSSYNSNNIQRLCTPYFTVQQADGLCGLKSYAPTLNVIAQFYTKNGLPIEDDRDWEDIDPMGLRTAEADDRWYIKQGFQTINLHFDREPRFYGAIFFDGGTYYGNQRIINDNTTNIDYMWVTELKAGDFSGSISYDRYSSTGYICKKLLHYMTTVPANGGGYSQYRYAFPRIRLADLYLMYAEALNEYKDSPDAEVYEYIDKVRERTGLDGVVESWQEHAIATAKNKPLTREGMRDIIRRERFNELAFEGPRFWDLRRWKLAETYMNRPAYGLNIYGATANDFYRVTEIYPLKFEKKDYFWPIKTSTLLNNPNLLQSKGWN